MAGLLRCLVCPPSVASPPEARRRRRLPLPNFGRDAIFQIRPAKISDAPGFLQSLKAKPDSDATRDTPDCTCDVGSNCHHQTLVTAPAFFKSLVAVNALTLMIPLEALAETCENNNSLFNMPLLFAIAMVGATVGGLLARQRRGELARLNEQLRQINAALRRQAKIESYAPTLSYAPTTKVTEAEVVVDPRKAQLLTRLRTGKNFLRNQDPEKAFSEFKTAIDLAQMLDDHVNEKKAARGLGASLQRQGNYKEAIKYHSRVLEISKRTGEESGSTEAYGAIADCYTELGDLERAGKFYDKYIARLESD
ncbi:tetratricopeptide repeat (TPR)-like superfamily protein [Wolffia australiana]